MLLLLLLQGQGLLEVLLLLLLLLLLLQAWAYAKMCVHGHPSRGTSPCSPCCGCSSHSLSARDPSRYELCSRTVHHMRRMDVG